MANRVAAALLAYFVLSLLFASFVVLGETTERVGSARTAGEIMKEQVSGSKDRQLTADDTIGNLLSHPAFAGFGRLLLPWDDRAYDNGRQLRNIGSLLPFHTHVDAETVVGALNHMIDDVSTGRTVFYEFYPPEGKKEQPAKSNTGLFFFRGKPGAPFAVIAPGGGFSYVGSVHESQRGLEGGCRVERRACPLQTVKS
jgi:hypothetical protein